MSVKNVYIETFGCQMNVSDSERAATLLETKGYKIVPDEKAADVVLFNTCSVREKAEHKLYTRIGEVRNSEGKKPVIGVTGCVAQLEGETLFDKADGVDFVLGTQATGRVDVAVEQALLNKTQKYLDLSVREENYDWSVSETQRISNYIAFVPIIEGCNKFCTYCIVPFSRGRERSLPADLIIKEILQLKRQGIKEIHLIGQNVNSYRPKTDTGLEGFAGATPFSKLLRAVAATGIERIKFTTSFPRDFHPDIVAAINENANLCNWVHLPVQSGSEKILRAMRRGHNIESYKKRIDIIRSSPRKISLTTDIIIGFPGETEKDFEDTVDLFQYCQYDSAYIFKYSVRHGTPSSALPDDVSEETKKRRFLILDKLQRELTAESLKSMVGKTVDVLAEKFSSKNPNELAGHTTCQKLVNFHSSVKLPGSIYPVKITAAKSNTLYGIALN